MPLILDHPPAADRNSPPVTPLDEREARRKQHHEGDVVIVGAGIFGAAAAVALGRQGRSVILLEKSLKEPDRIVGELLQPGGVAALEKLGLRDCLEGIDAILCRGYGVTYHGEEILLSYPASASGDGRRAEGRSFHHGRLIQNLRTAAMKEPNVTVVESTAVGLIKDDWTGQVLGVESTTKGSKDYYFGELTLVADGYNSKFRKSYHPHQPATRSRFWGLELIDAELPAPYYGHVIIGDGAPILLYQIGAHETRVLVDVPEGTPTAAPAAGGIKGHMRNAVLPSLPKSLQSSFEVALDHGSTLRSMPNSFLPPATNRTAGLVMVGDAMNMRHPLTGGGMTVAFNDVVLLSELLSPEATPRLSDTKKVLKQLRTFHWRRKARTSVVNILAMALYSLFAAEDDALRTLQLGCFRYFHRGGACVDEPISLLGGIMGSPIVLVYHFFAVALYAIWIRLSAAPIWKLPVVLLSSVGVFWKACVVIFPYIFAEVRW